MKYPWFSGLDKVRVFFSIFVASGRKCQEFDLQKVMWVMCDREFSGQKKLETFLCQLMENWWLGTGFYGYP